MYVLYMYYVHIHYAIAIATKVFIGKLPATRGVWVIIGGHEPIRQLQDLNWCVYLWYCCDAASHIHVHVHVHVGVHVWDWFLEIRAFDGSLGTG